MRDLKPWSTWTQLNISRWLQLIILRRSSLYSFFIFVQKFPTILEFLLLSMWNLYSQSNPVVSLSSCWFYINLFTRVTRFAPGQPIILLFCFFPPRKRMYVKLATSIITTFLRNQKKRKKKTRVWNCEHIEIRNYVHIFLYSYKLNS
jgi:hypothetical protein